jgi:hypothetical protein
MIPYSLRLLTPQTVNADNDKYKLQTYLTSVLINKSKTQQPSMRQTNCREQQKKQEKYENVFAYI